MQIANISFLFMNVNCLHIRMVCYKTKQQLNIAIGRGRSSIKGFSGLMNSVKVKQKH